MFTTEIDIYSHFGILFYLFILLSFTLYTKQKQLC